VLLNIIIFKNKKELKMKLFKLLVIGLIVMLSDFSMYGMGGCIADEYRGIEFSQGSASFADSVVSYTPSSGVSSPYNNPANALGIPDYSQADDNFVSLGDAGVLICKFTDNSLTTSGDNSYDLWIFEIGDQIEPTSVAISTNGSDWINVGYTSGATSGIDIDAYINSGVVKQERYSFVKLTDLMPHQSGSPYEGADIDAVGAISSASPVITCEDSDLDARYEAGKQYCKDNPEACGISTGDGGFSQADIDAATQQAVQKCKTNPASCGITTDGDCQSDGDGCAILESNLNITMPCIDVFGTRLPIGLDKFTNKEDPFGYYWKLNLQ
jgi:hypothetical protein